MRFRFKVAVCGDHVVMPTKLYHPSNVCLTASLNWKKLLVVPFNLAWLTLRFGVLIDASGTLENLALERAICQCFSKVSS